MNRLTKKNEKYNLIVNDKYNPIATTREINNKLGKLEDLEEQIGCPLEIRCKVVPNSYIYTYETSMETQDIIAKRKVSNISKEEIYISYTTASGRKRDMTLSWKSYKTLWWLKKNREE